MRDDEVNAHERTNATTTTARVEDARTHRARIPHRSRANKRTEKSRVTRARQ
jgi:hypothetical protein